MVKMIRSEGNTIRPRKPTGWTSDGHKSRKNPIFKISENDYNLNVSPAHLSYGYPQSDTSSKRVRVHDDVPNEMKRSILSQLEKYCENTTLHGLRYVGDSHLTFGERIFWFISFSLAIGFAAYYISNIYAKWRSSPVIISFSPFDAELSSIPFPAITICNMNQAKRNEAEKILKEGTNVEKKLLDDACNGNATFENTENISWESLRDFLVRVGNSCSDILKSCQWGSDKIDCGEAFNNDLTDEGLCCSFNRLPPEKIFRNMKDISILNQTYPSKVYDWNAEKGYQDSKSDDYIPRRPLGAGAHLGLSLILDAQIDNYYCSSTRSTGFKVILSNPIETPKMADFGFLISPGFETRITIEPSVREATSSLRDVPIEKRQCYFSNERPLQYYREYTKNNCRLECHSKSSLLRCGCVPFHLPRNSSDNVKVCDVDDKCADWSKDLIDKQHSKENFQIYESDECDCLASCSGVDYSFSASGCPLLNFADKQRIFNNYTKKYILTNFNKMDFFFQSITYSKTEKRAIYNFTDLVASTGGLLGFFVGFSFLSGVELFFHMVWLLWKNHTMKKQENHQKNNRLTVEPKQPFLIFYTQMNCMQECHSNVSMKVCHCIPYHLPKNVNTPYCSKADDNCTKSVRDDVDDLKNGSYLDGECHCKPGCFEISYKHSISGSPIFNSSLLKNNVTPEKINNYVVVSFFFKHETSQKQVKNLLYGFSEIMSNFGGILSLCLGISFLSVVELAYFLSLRMLCIYLRRQRDQERVEKKRGNLIYPTAILKEIQTAHL